MEFQHFWNPHPEKWPKIIEKDLYKLTFAGFSIVKFARQTPNIDRLLSMIEDNSGPDFDHSVEDGAPEPWHSPPGAFVTRVHGGIYGEPWERAGRRPESMRWHVWWALGAR